MDAVNFRDLCCEWQTSSLFSLSHVKVDVPNKFGFTALMVAAQKGYTRYGFSLSLEVVASMG